jgi:ring-1,2-phenylacetyl-CoA epoxidase subunit PaaE
LNTYTLKIIEIRKETEDTSTISFKQPALKKITYLPGQYITLILQINNRKYRRPYSFSSAPETDATLDITVKRMSHGIVSNHLLDIVKVGDAIEVMGPMGEFIYNKERMHDGALFMWGAGSGITPLMSILKTALHSQKKVTLIYGNRNLRQTIFYDELLKIKEQYSDRFSLFNFFTKEKQFENKVAFFQGRIDAERITQILALYKDKSDSLHYICGPVELKKVVKAVLLQNDIKPENIFTENFEHKVDENQLKEVRTTFVNLKKDGQRVKLEVIKGKSILEAGLDQQMDLAYSCQTGTCFLCKATKLSGNIKMVGNETAPEKLGEDECLLCCSYPLSDDVEVEIK